MNEADRFVPLHTWLAGPPPEAPAPIAPPPPAPCAEPEHEPGTSIEPAWAPAVDALRDVRLFRARLADALDQATATLVRDFAYAVLGRELVLAPADVAAIAGRILAEHPAAEPVVFRHAPGERVELGVPVAVDPALAPGDLLVTFTAGNVDARLGVRLAAVLEAWS